MFPSQSTAQDLFPHTFFPQSQRISQYGIVDDGDGNFDQLLPPKPNRCNPHLGGGSTCESNWHAGDIMQSPVKVFTAREVEKGIREQKTGSPSSSECYSSKRSIFHGKKDSI